MPSNEASIEMKEKKLNPTIAMVLSILLAGLGQIYNKRYIKGISFIVLEIAFIVATFDFLWLGLWGDYYIRNDTRCGPFYIFISLWNCRIDFTSICGYFLCF